MMADYIRTLRSLPQTPYWVLFVPAPFLAAFYFGGEWAMLAVSVVLPCVLALTVSRTPDPKASPDDELTGQLSRDGLIDWVDAALPRASAGGQQVTVMVLALDDIDVIEERLGRPTRDDMLREAVRKLKGFLRPDDAIARIGNSIGIAFDNVRVPETETVLNLARRLQRCLEPPSPSAPPLSHCTVSVGIAVQSHIKASSGLNLVAGAQRATQQAIASGPGSVHLYNGGLPSEAMADRTIADELSNALDTNEIFAWFQPQVRASDGKVVGFEALARWDHPDRGVVTPNNFLPDIEKAGLSQRLTEVVLKQALMALNTWDAAGFDVTTVSVNFSNVELRNPRLPDYVRWELDRHGIAPERLVVEVLETVVSESREDVVSRTLMALSRIGCRIDLDDFGTGTTCFMSVNRFDVDRIKIDRSMVNNVDSDADQHAMLSAILAFCDRLDIETLAEGVETMDEAGALASLGCSTVQGYAISRPLPLGETLLWLEDGAEAWDLRGKTIIRNTG